MKINPHNAFLSMEMIGYQYNDPFVKNTENILQRYQEKVIDKVTLTKELSEAIKTRFNLNLNLTLEENKEPNAYALPINLSTRNVLNGLNNFNDKALYSAAMLTRNNAIKIAKGDVDGIGLLDFKNAKVEGIFALLDSHIVIHTGLLDELNPKEIVAIILHEIGHIWTYFEYLAVSTYRNAITVNAAKEFLKTNKPEERYKILVALDNDYGLPVDKDVLNLPDEKAVTVIVSSMSKMFTSDPRYDLYTIKNAEALADQFASRFGLLESSISAMKKLDKKSWQAARELGERYYKLFKGFSVTSFLSTIATGAAFGAAIATTAIPLYIASVIFSVTAVTTSRIAGKYSLNGQKIQTSMDTSAYDKPKDRLQRLYNETLTALKDTSLPTEMKKQILDSLAVVKKEIENAPTTDTSWVKILVNVSPEYNKMNEQRRNHQIIESLMSNELYVAAAKLSTINSQHE